MTMDPRNGGTADEGPFEEPLRSAAQQFHQPPPVPREEMGAVIASPRNTGRAEAPGTLRFRRRAARPARGPAFRLAAGIAALLVLGIGIGRFTAPDANAPRRLAFAASRYMLEASIGLRNVSSPLPR